MQVSGSRVLVTGASRGIGEGIVRRFAAAGAEVVGAARSAEALDRLAADTGCAPVAFDAADPGRVDGFIDRVEHEHGPIDILVNNAGVEVSGLLEDTAAADIDRTVQVNLVAPMQLTRQIVPRLLERGRGHLVFTSSIAATGGAPTASIYSSTKAGLTRFAESARMELADDGIGVTILHLGPIATSMWDRLGSDQANDVAMARGKRLGALAVGTVESVADATLAAVENGRREVRIPRRMAVAPLVNGVNTRLTELVYRGIDFRAEHGKRPD
jgi:short-subunit dehydrogenase